MRYFMFVLITIVGILVINSCAQKSNNKQNDSSSKDSTESIKTDDSSVIILKDSSNEINQQHSDYATYYIIIADTGKDYFTLRNKMVELNKTSHLSIDTLGRYYNKKKKMIVAESGVDEFYAGEYFPRRFPSESMSLEYLSYYKKEADKKTIALVTGIFEDEKAATKNYNLLIQSGIKPIKLKTEMYIGCVH